MKLIPMAASAFLLACPPVSAQQWSPVPLVINCPDCVMYHFDGYPIDIPFSLSGKPAAVWLVVQTRLADSEKPVAVMNGFRGWHFVNGIDTTVYVSPVRHFEPGNNQTFPWDGRGSEREYEDLMDSGPIPPGMYTYALFGYDNRSAREVANDFIAIGFLTWPQLCRFTRTMTGPVRCSRTPCSWGRSGTVQPAGSMTGGAYSSDSGSGMIPTIWRKS
jgi:hypothetical protein